MAGSTTSSKAPDLRFDNHYVPSMSIAHNMDHHVVILRLIKPVRLGPGIQLAPFGSGSAKEAPRKGDLVYAVGYGIRAAITEPFDANYLKVQQFKVVSGYVENSTTFQIEYLGSQPADTQTTYGDQGGPVFTPLGGVIGMIRSNCDLKLLWNCPISAKAKQPVTYLFQHRFWIDNIRNSFGEFARRVLPPTLRSFKKK